ncbi:MAG TPA: M14 family zinc carboxypeptidase [Solirubrobacterales bacterium]|nr:M14 family zinc carboxypeptidase [Solirubrobacterales bacterium]
MRRTAAGFMCLGVAMFAAPALADAEMLTSTRAVERDCAGGLGGAGTDSAPYVSPGRGFVTARLKGGPHGDWELAAFRRGEPFGASTAMGSDERIGLWAERGQRFVIQACRTDGGSRAVRLDTSFASVAPEPTEPASLARVPIAGPEDVAELERMGVDVTHEVGPDSATVVLYSRKERLRLNERGFGVEVLIPDLAAADAADRRVEARVAARGVPSELPSGRTEYRQYVDYTDELDALASANPDIAREVTIGTSLEGRPIQGIEIAADVDATDDGRPVYVQLGAHHAREWPSAELPMEFAIDLIENYGTDARITGLLDEVRVLVVPVVNVDGFLASRSFGTSPLDDDQVATLPDAAAGANAYRRKNCRPISPADALVPCAMRTSGVDLNRNYGYYWGGPGSSSDPTSSGYRGDAPYSEPESQAVHELSRGIHPTVFISNHTFTDEGLWLRQPGFDAPFLPQDSIGATTPDETAMKDLGDDMQGATGWRSERGYESLGDITGATEDWNYFAQGSYGYTPEVRGLNFHANYQDSVIEEYAGDAAHPGLGAGEAYLIAGERAADRAQHSVIEGSAPAEATLRLRKDFEVPLHPNQGASFADHLETTLDAPAAGAYEWDVMPSGRPFAEGETWTMTCELPGEDPVSQEVFVARGEAVTIDWAADCAAGGGSNQPTCRGTVATLVGTPGNDRGRSKLDGTPVDDVIVARKGNDVVIANQGDDIVCGGAGDDKIYGSNGDDVLRGGPGKDICPAARPSEVRSCRAIPRVSD